MAAMESTSDSSLPTMARLATWNMRERLAGLNLQPHNCSVVLNAHGYTCWKFLHACVTRLAHVSSPGWTGVKKTIISPLLTHNLAQTQNWLINLPRKVAHKSRWISFQKSKLHTSFRRTITSKWRGYASASYFSTRKG